MREKAKSGQKLAETQLKMEVEAFFSSKVTPALEEVKIALAEFGREVEIRDGLESLSILIRSEGRIELEYEVKVRNGRPFPVTHFEDKGKALASEGSFRSGSQSYGIADISEEEIRDHLLSQYKGSLS